MIPALNPRDLGPARHRIMFRSHEFELEVEYWGHPPNTPLRWDFLPNQWGLQRSDCLPSEVADIDEMCAEHYRQRQIAWCGERANVKKRRWHRVPVARDNGSAA